MEHPKEEEAECLCERCHGEGRITYGNTSTWRGGIGGCAMTEDVCNKCWGSGNQCKPFERPKR